MSRRNKRAKVPVPSSITVARSQGVTTEDARKVHLKYIDDRWELIAAISWKEYLAHGRGALLFQVEPQSEGEWDCTYIPLREIQINPLMSNEARLVREYDPETQVVSIFLVPPSSIPTGAAWSRSVPAHDRLTRTWPPS